MKSALIVVGKTTDKHLAALIDDYRQRISHYMGFEIVTIAELKQAKSLDRAQIKTKEGLLIMNLLHDSDYVVLLDEHGKSLRSIEFAAWIEKKQAKSMKRLVFVVGGAYGFDQSIYDRADEMMSLSNMTFSHQMIRLIFVEQLYRACTINKNEPYHHE